MQRWDQIEQALGVLDDQTHDWDVDPAVWVRSQRSADA